MTEQERIEIFKMIEDAYEYIAKASKLLEEAAVKLTEKA